MPTQTETRSARDITRWLVAEIAKLTSIPADQLDVEEPITTYLTDSRDALSLAGDLQTWLGVELSASIMWDHPTIAALASFMVQEVLPGEQGQTSTGAR
jgi:acyl carrier protein